MASSNLKQQQDLEVVYHEKVHQSLKVLMLSYKPSERLEPLLKMGMFEKSNQPGFQHVMHYLLTIIDNDTFNKRIPWPLHDFKLESLFRKEVRSYVEDLSKEYPNLQIPHVHGALFHKPGGFKFVRVIFHLCQLALLKHIQEKRPKIKLFILEEQDRNKSETLETLKCLKSEVLLRVEQKTSVIEQLHDKALGYVKLYKEEIARNESRLAVCKQRLNAMFTTPGLSEGQKQSLIDGSAIPDWKASIDVQIDRVSLLDAKVKSYADLCKQAFDLANTILSREEKKQCFRYEGNLDMKPAMSIVAAKDLPILRSVVVGDVLNLPNLLLAVSAMLTAITPAPCGFSDEISVVRTLDSLQEGIGSLKGNKDTLCKLHLEVTAMIAQLERSIQQRSEAFDLYSLPNINRFEEMIMETPPINVRLDPTQKLTGHHESHWLSDTQTISTRLQCVPELFDKIKPIYITMDREMVASFKNKVPKKLNVSVQNQQRQKTLSVKKSDLSYTGIGTSTVKKRPLLSAEKIRQLFGSTRKLLNTTSRSKMRSARLRICEADESINIPTDTTDVSLPYAVPLPATPQIMELKLKEGKSINEYTKVKDNELEIESFGKSYTGDIKEEPTGNTPLWLEPPNIKDSEVKIESPEGKSTGAIRKVPAITTSLHETPLNCKKRGRRSTVLAMSTPEIVELKEGRSVNQFTKVEDFELETESFSTSYAGDMKDVSTGNTSLWLGQPKIKDGEVEMEFADGLSTGAERKLFTTFSKTTATTTSTHKTPLIYKQLSRRSTLPANSMESLMNALNVPEMPVLTPLRSTNAPIYNDLNISPLGFGNLKRYDNSLRFSLGKIIGERTNNDLFNISDLSLVSDSDLD